MTLHIFVCPWSWEIIICKHSSNWEWTFTIKPSLSKWWWRKRKNRRWYFVASLEHMLSLLGGGRVWKTKAPQKSCWTVCWAVWSFLEHISSYSHLLLPYMSMLQSKKITKLEASIMVCVWICEKLEVMMTRLISLLSVAAVTSNITSCTTKMKLQFIVPAWSPTSKASCS